MMTSIRQRVLLIMPMILAVWSGPSFVCGQDAFNRDGELSHAKVEQAIRTATQYLLREQNRNGSWTVADGQRTTGVTALVVLALLNCEMTPEDDAVDRGLKYLRAAEIPLTTYDISLMIMAFAAANEPGKDFAKVSQLAALLADGQLKRGQNKGTWDYSVRRDAPGIGGDRSNGQFAILGLRDAVRMGVKVQRSVWDLAYQHWLTSQTDDGSWGYSSGRSHGYGSMTVAGVATMTIVTRMRAEGNDEKPDGTPQCCLAQKLDPSIEKGIRWLESIPRDFIINPRVRQGNWLLYYLYGLERAGRLTGRRFFGKWDWYREGAKFLVNNQPIGGQWEGRGSLEKDPVVGTSLGLLFLSKGLAPVLINKLEYGALNPFTGKVISTDWNQHHDDARNLAEWISGRPQWPKLLTTQTINIKKLTEKDGPKLLRQAPILLITGKQKLSMITREARLLRKFVDEGGFILAVRNCGTAEFDDSFKQFVETKMYPGEAKLRRLNPDHPVFRSEFLLDPAQVELHGVDFGCRTPIIYCPDDISCLWNKWLPFDPPKRSGKMKESIQSALKVGANIIAYATGREPPSKLEGLAKPEEEGVKDEFDAGFLRIAKLRHGGGWDTAPRSVENLLKSIKERTGILTSTKRKDFSITDENIYEYPILYMHGRSSFQLSDAERDQLRTYLNRGGVLFADSCCAAKPFDQSFRVLMKQVFPDSELERIPMAHELFSTNVGFDIKSVRRRALKSDAQNTALETKVERGEPFLEGIEVDGRYPVIYSKYDISCAMERQSNGACSGYISEDAFKIAINVVRYTMLQELRLPNSVDKK